MTDLVQELRRATRSLVRDPTFTLAATLTLALGIGATTAVFSVLDGVLLAPLPYPGGERIVRVFASQDQAGLQRAQMAAADMVDLRDAASLEAVAAFFGYEGTIEDASGNPIRVPGYAVSGGFFDVFGLPMFMGRGFAVEDEGRDTGGVQIVLSHRLWSALGADPEIVGRTIPFEATQFEVVGVAPPDMVYPRDAQLWAAPGLDWANFPRRTRNFDVVARLRPGVDIRSAQTEVSVVATRLERAYPDTNVGVDFELVSLKETIVGDLSAALVLLMVASGGLLAIAAANVGNLLLARGAARLPETAMRSALGASRSRLVGGLLLEALLIGLSGAAAGVALALAGIEVFKVLAPPAISLLGDVTFGWRALAFGGLVSVGSALLFGLLPAVRATATDIRELLGEGGRGGTPGSGGAWIRSGLVVLEVGLATALVIGSGLLVRSFQNIRNTDPGFETREALTFSLAPPIGAFGSLDEVDQFYRALLDDLTGLPGSYRATITSALPLAGQNDIQRVVRLTDQPEPEPGDEAQALLRFVSPGYFETMGVPILEGRAFNPFDGPDSRTVVIVNEAFVRRYLNDGRALGQPLEVGPLRSGPLGRTPGEEAEIVGVAGDVRHRGLTQEARPAVYLPTTQASYRQMTVVLAGERAGELLPAVRERVAGVSNQVALSRISTLEAVVRASTVSQRFVTTLLSAFGIAALGLAVVGIYGVVAYSVTERTREMAIRMALGAAPRDVFRLVFLHSGRLWGSGIVGGVVGALLLRRILASQVYGMSATDPATFAVASLVLALVSVAATAVPAVRALALEPATVLHEG